MDGKNDEQTAPESAFKGNSKPKPLSYHRGIILIDVDDSFCPDSRVWSDVYPLQPSFTLLVTHDTGRFCQFQPIQHQLRRRCIARSLTRLTFGLSAVQSADGSKDEQQDQCITLTASPTFMCASLSHPVSLPPDSDATWRARPRLEQVGHCKSLEVCRSPM